MIHVLRFFLLFGFAWWWVICFPPLTPPLVPPLFYLRFSTGEFFYSVFLFPPLSMFLNFVPGSCICSAETKGSDLQRRSGSMQSL